MYPKFKSMLKFIENPDSEDITERSYPEDSDNDMTASTLFQGMTVLISKR